MQPIVGSSVHFKLQDLAGDHGICLLKINDTIQSSSDTVRQICNEALNAKESSILLNFRLSPDADLSTIRGSYSLNEADHESKNDQVDEDSAETPLEVAVTGIRAQQVQALLTNPKSIYRRKPKYSHNNEPNPTVHDVATRARKASLKMRLPLSIGNSSGALSPSENRSRQVRFPTIEGDDGTLIPRGCISHVDDKVVTEADFESIMETPDGVEKFSLINIFNRRGNSEGWSESREKKDATRSSHQWKEINEKTYSCSKCKAR